MGESKLLRIGVFLLVVVIAGIGSKYLLDVQEDHAAREAAIVAARGALLDEAGPQAAISVALTGLDAFPDEPELHLVRAIGLIAKNRLTDAEQALLVARTHAQASELRGEIDFHLARARVLRFVDAGDRGDRNLAESALESMRSDVRYGSSAQLLLGLAMAKGGDDPTAAAALLRAGLAGALAPGSESDAARARAALDNQQ